MEAVQVEFLLQQVDVRIARWTVGWERRELGQGERNGLSVVFVHDWHEKMTKNDIYED
jgi:hypothetical protein